MGNSLRKTIRSITCLCKQPQCYRLEDCCSWLPKCRITFCMIDVRIKARRRFKHPISWALAASVSPPPPGRRIGLPDTLDKLIGGEKQTSACCATCCRCSRRAPGGCCWDLAALLGQTDRRRERARTPDPMYSQHSVGKRAQGVLLLKLTSQKGASIFN